MEIKRLLESGYIIIPDTNVLLNLYRYSPEFSEFGLQCLPAHRRRRRSSARGPIPASGPAACSFSYLFLLWKFGQTANLRGLGKSPAAVRLVLKQPPDRVLSFIREERRSEGSQWRIENAYTYQPSPNRWSRAVAIRILPGNEFAKDSHSADVSTRLLTGRSQYIMVFAKSLHKFYKL